MLVNAVRGHFAKFGIIAPQGIRRVGELAALLIEEDATMLPPLARQALCALLAQLHALEEQIASLEAAVIAGHRDNGASRRLASIPGVGPITASAIVASVADAHQFKSARHFGSMARPDASVAFDGWQGAAWRDLQTRGSLSAPSACDGSHLRDPLRQEEGAR